MTKTHKRYRRIGAPMVAAVALALALSACGATGDPLSNPETTGSGGTGSDGPLVVGSAAFPESEIIAEIYAGALEAAGVKAKTKPAIGSREIYVGAVRDGSVDLVPEYSGNLLLFFNPDATAASAEEIMDALPRALPEGLAVLEPAEAQNKDSMVITQATSEKYDLTSLADIGDVCGELVLGAPPEFAERAYGLKGLKEKYGCEFKSFEPLNDGGGAVTVQALIENDIQVADIFTTTPAIEDHGLVVLEDPKNNFIAQQVLPLISEERVGEQVRDVLNSVSAELTTDDLISLNRQVSGDQKLSAEKAAHGWLEENGFLE
ncbi:ABC transporter substrate-binding protein [Arthrobacter castelli]|uniref:ABC transporter substrate-binding protein n=1 Tax=Arthrobacter castelli TaxID=271431 RepID=UPI0004089DC7|nr:ABC transporter substrate-binding protein [Arthrobacter castelli]